MPVAVELAEPRWLLALPVLVAVLLVARWPWWAAARRMPAGQRRVAVRREGGRLAIRLGWLTLLVLVLAGATLARPLRRQAVVFVVDASASVAPVRDAAEAAVRTALDALRREDVAGVVAAAGGAQVEERPVARPVFSGLRAAVADGASDLAAGLRLGAALLPRGYTGRVLLVSDGRQTHGDAIGAARDLAARGVLVDVLPVGAPAADVRLEAVDLPETAYAGEAPALTARLYATQATASVLRVYRDDQLVTEREVALRPGPQEVALLIPSGEPGLHRYRVDVAGADPALDATTANNTLGAVQRVVGPPRVLVVAQTPEAAGLLPGVLEAGGAVVTVANPAGVPADLAGWARYDTVVLADVPATALPPGAMEQLEFYVRDLGRGLVMAGGPDSFGPGGYAETPVERALPVYMDLRGRGKQPSVALMLVIDKSGSMSGAKMEMAKEAAARSIRLLRPDDRAAVLGFDSIPQWVAPLTPLTERAALEASIGSIFAGGGTEIYPAVAAAYEALRDVDAGVKHVIVMTDGQSNSGGDYAALLQQMREARISLSAVAVGSDADTGLLEAMARVGRGRYHFAADPAAIPQIFTRETIMATRSILVESHFYPAAASGGPLLRGIAAVAPLDGYVAVTPKERAEVALVSPEGDPVLAAWQYGTGRSVAWTPDVTARWSSAWIGSPAATALWGNVLSWLLPPPQTGELTVRVEAEAEGAGVPSGPRATGVPGSPAAGTADQTGSGTAGDRGVGAPGAGAVVSVVAENRSGWDTVRSTRATVLGPNGQRREVDLAPAGPGRYRARLEVPEPGAYVVQVTQAIPGTAAGDTGAELRTDGGWVAPYPAEYRAAGVDPAFLTQVARAGGGRVLQTAAEAVAPAARVAVARWPLWPVLLVLAALLWPLEIASRRLTTPGAAAWLPQLRARLTPARRRLPASGRAAAGQAGAAVPAPAGVPAALVPQPPATTQRLLERKRAVQERRRELEGVGATSAAPTKASEISEHQAMAESGGRPAR